MKKCPWWGTVLLAIAAYCGLKYGMPRILSPESPLSDLIPLFAPIMAMGLLLLAGKQLYDDEPDTSETAKPPDSSPDQSKKGSKEV